MRAQIVGGNVEITVDAQGDADVDLWAAQLESEAVRKSVRPRGRLLRKRLCHPPRCKSAASPANTSLDATQGRRQSKHAVDAAGNPDSPALRFFARRLRRPRQPDRHLALAAIGPRVVGDRSEGNRRRRLSLLRVVLRR